MNPRIKHLIQHPFQVQLSDVALLQDEIEKYPYFSVLRNLLLFAMKEYEHSSYPAELKKTSIYSPSRVALYYYLQKEQQQTAAPLAEITEQEIETPEPVESKSETESISQEAVESIENFEASGNPIEDLTELEVVEEKPEIYINPHSEMTFSNWLSLSKTGTDKEEERPSEKDIKYKLIDEFIEKSPKIPAVDKNQKTETVQVNPNFQPEYTDLMTETLAQIYVDQKKYDKAIRAYKILSLKYPDKKQFFEEQIRVIGEIGNL